MENRYDLSFMKDYAEVFERDIRWLSTKFHCGITYVDKILKGEYKVKEGPLEEIMYEFGYSDYESFKNGIIEKTNERKSNLQKTCLFSPIRFNFNNMSNTNRIIISMLCENENASVTKMAKFLNIKDIDIKTLFKTNALSKERDFLPKTEEIITTRENVNCDTETSEIFDYNLMGNQDRIIVSLLCDENLIYSIEQIVEFTKYDEEYVKKVYKKVISNIGYVSKIEPGYQKTKA